MLAQLKIKLDSETLNYKNTSLLQGLMFERIDSDYAQYLHSQSMHPYSQYISRENGKAVWIISTLDKDAYEQIVLPLLKPDFQEIHIAKQDESIPILAREIETLSKKELMEEFYEQDAPGSFKTKFETATAFKQSGRYCILPDVRLIFQNLMNRYTAASDKVDMTDEEMLADICDAVFISRHQMRSVVFPLEGTKIPGFMGEVTFQTKAGMTIKKYIRLLLKFGEYSGIGIKTAMGMGAFSLDGGKEHD